MSVSLRSPVMPLVGKMDLQQQNYRGNQRHQKLEEHTVGRHAESNVMLICSLTGSLSIGLSEGIGSPSLRRLSR